MLYQGKHIGSPAFSGRRQPGDFPSCEACQMNILRHHYRLRTQVRSQVQDLYLLWIYEKTFYSADLLRRASD